MEPSSMAQSWSLSTPKTPAGNLPLTTSELTRAQKIVAAAHHADQIVAKSERVQ